MPKDFDSSKLGFSSGKFGSTTNENINYEIWIDISSGLVTKTSCSNKENSNITIEYNLKLNSITEEDVTMPDLSKYKVTEL